MELLRTSQDTEPYRYKHITVAVEEVIKLFSKKYENYITLNIQYFKPHIQNVTWVKV